MVDFASALTLDQLEVLVAIVDSGSFSAAARRLRRTQGAVSYHVAGLEAQLEVTLFDRSGRAPALTPAGAAVVAHARRILADVGALRTTARAITSGLEARLAMAVTVLFPPARLAPLLARFRAEFPTVDLHLRSGILEAVPAAVRAGEADLGLVSFVHLGDDLAAQPACAVELIPVIAAGHPLAAAPEPIDDEELQRIVHIILSDDAAPAPETVSGFPSTRRWRMNDALVRLELIRAGLGWARLPDYLVAEDLARGTLAPLRAKRWDGRKSVVDLYVARVRDRPLGPAGRWLWDQLTGAP